MDATGRIKETMTRLGLSNADVARITGKSPATISQVIKGSYPRADMGEEILAALASHELDTDSAVQSTWATEGQNLIQSLLSFTYEDRELSVITGPSGIGKTHTIKRFMQHNEACLYFRCADGMSAGDVVAGLLDELGVSMGGTNTQKIRRCVRAIKEQGIRLVLVDEADLLVSDDKNKRRILKKLSYFREINESGIGVALVGLESFEDALRAAGETYVLSRIGYYRRAPGVRMTELFAFWEMQGMETSEEARMAVNMAPRGGQLRFLKKLAALTKPLGGSVREALKLMFSTASHIKEV